MLATNQKKAKIFFDSVVYKNRTSNKKTNTNIFF